MTVRDDAIKAVPLGPAHKASARKIWARVGMWAFTSVRHQLDQLADEGVIVRSEEKIPGGVRHLFHREAA